MCGRFSLTATEQSLEERFNAELDAAWSPSYNIAPSAKLSTIILDEEPGVFQELTWGIHPKWMKTARGLINIRAESVIEKPYFRKSVEQRRCLVPATSFYEWKPEGATKQPYFIGLKDEPIFTFAGTWSEEPVEDGSTRRTFAILTTEVNELLSPIHNRMPVILHPDDEQKWLSQDVPFSELLSLMSPYESDLMRTFPVSTKVNNPRNNHEALLNPL